MVEQHWSYMDQFAATRTARGPTFTSGAIEVSLAPESWRNQCGTPPADEHGRMLATGRIVTDSNGYRVMLKPVGSITKGVTRAA